MEELEIEIKVPLKLTGDPHEQGSAVRDMVEILDMTGWSYDNTEVHRDLYLSHPSRDFSQTDEAIRIRTVKDRDDGRVSSYLTYKGPKVSHRSKSRFEKEIRIPSASDMRDILYRLGFGKVLIVEKERRIFRQDVMEASIDTVTELGCFLELETRDSDIEKGEQRLLRAIEDLDLEGGERRSYLEMILQK